MSSTFPGSLDSITDPTPDDTMDGRVGGLVHSQLLALIGTAVEAIESTVGVTGSTDPESLTYRIDNGAGVPTLDLSYNGNGPMACQVLNGLSWDPSTGGFLYIVMPGALSGFPVDIPAVAEVDGSGVIQGFLTFGYGGGGAHVLAFGPTGSPANVDIIGLCQGNTDGNPGDTVPGGIPSVQGMIVPDVDGSAWVCTSSAPDATWAHLLVGGGVPTETVTIIVDSSPIAVPMNVLPDPSATPTTGVTGSGSIEGQFTAYVGAIDSDGNATAGFCIRSGNLYGVQSGVADIDHPLTLSGGVWSAIAGDGLSAGFQADAGSGNANIGVDSSGNPTIGGVNASGNTVGIATDGSEATMAIAAYTGASVTASASNVGAEAADLNVTDAAGDEVGLAASSGSSAVQLFVATVGAGALAAYARDGVPDYPATFLSTVTGIRLGDSTGGGVWLWGGPTNPNDSTDPALTSSPGDLYIQPTEGPTVVWICTAGGTPGTWVPYDSTPVLSLSYAAAGPFPVPCWGIPAGYVPGEGIATLGAQLTVGSNIGSGLLLDATSNPIPDGWSFPAAIFVEGSTIYDIVATNGYTIDSAQGGVITWGSSGGAPVPTPMPGGITSPGVVVLSNLPTSDPANAGQLWSNSGVVTVSAG